jgi:oxalate---CoA ligase
MALAAKLAENARRHGRRPFLIDASNGQPTSFADVQDRAAEFDDALRGITGPVGLAMAEPGAYAAAYVALLSLGRTVVPLAPNAPAAESARLLEAAGATHSIASTGQLCEVRAASRQGAGLAGGGVVMFTSGTTGAPKGVDLRSDQLWANAGAVVAAHDFQTGDVGLCPLPLWHINAQVVGVLAALRAGSCMVLDAGFHRSRFWAAAREHQITWVNAAPAIIHILGVADDDDAAVPPTLRFVRSASAPLPVSDRERFESRFAVPIIESYGMTEAAGMITVNSLGRARKIGSAGAPAGVKLRVVDDDAQLVPPGTLGAVQISGPSVITGYLDGERADQFTADGWLVTGDLGHLDADGDLFLAGRSDDVINRGGEMVHPREVEDVVLDHRLVSSAAVVGIADAKLGERVVALIVRGTDTTRSDDEVAAELEALAREHLSAFKRPSEYRFVAELPVGSTGKIRHGAARSMIEATLAEPALS